MSNTTLRGIRGAMAEGLVGHFGSGRGHPRPLSETELRDYLNRLHIDAGSVGASGLGVNFNITTFLDKIGSVQGDILYRDADAWAVLDPGTDGQVLTTHGSAANPTWEDAASPTPPLTHNHIFVGDASNVAADVAMSGDATIADTGAVTVVGTHLADGSAAAPSGSIHASDTGFFWDSANSAIGLSISGSNVAGIKGVGYAQTISGGGASSIVATGEGNTFSQAHRISSDALGPSNNLIKGRGSIASETAVLQNDVLGNFQFYGANGAGTTAGARISAVVIEPTPGPSAMGSRLSFTTAALGASTQTESLRLAAAQQNILGPLKIGSISATPDASALVDQQSTTQGFLVPRMTTTQRNAISSPAEGLEVHDTTVKAHFIYQNGAWAQVATGGSIPTGANPTATASDVAVNGSASTFMRSDAAPAVQKCSTSQFGLCKPDGTSITASGGVLTAVSAASAGMSDWYTPGGISKPLAANFSLVRSTTSTTSALSDLLNNRGTSLSVPADSGSRMTNLQAYNVAPGNTAFTLTACLSFNGIPNSEAIGVYARDNTGKIYGLWYFCGGAVGNFGGGTSALQAATFASINSFTSASSLTSFSISPRPLWLRMVLSSGNIFFYVSLDGENFCLLNGAGTANPLGATLTDAGVITTVQNSSTNHIYDYFVDCFSFTLT
jgi:hypothetical protein